MARPRAKINEDVVAAMAFMGASNRDIAGYVGVDHKTIANRFSPILAKRRAERKMRLLQTQWQAAMRGNATMLIFLGKRELGQRDSIELSPETLEKYSDRELERLIKDGRRR